MKVAINKCYGGFSVTEEVFKELGLTYDGYGFLDNKNFDINSDNYYQYRSDSKLIEAIEKVGIGAASGSCAEIEIIEIPDDVSWEIDEYDGIETIHECHRIWG